MPEASCAGDIQMRGILTGGVAGAQAQGLPPCATPRRIAQQSAQLGPGAKRPPKLRGIRSCHTEPRGFVWQLLHWRANARPASRPGAPEVARSWVAQRGAAVGSARTATRFSFARETHFKPAPPQPATNTGPAAPVRADAGKRGTRRRSAQSARAVLRTKAAKRRPEILAGQTVDGKAGRSQRELGPAPDGGAEAVSEMRACPAGETDEAATRRAQRPALPL